MKQYLESRNGGNGPEENVHRRNGRGRSRGRQIISSDEEDNSYQADQDFQTEEDLTKEQNRLQVILKENEDLKNQIVSAMRSKPGTPVQNLTSLLKDLYECATRNSGKQARGIRYSEELKDLGTLLYLLSGKMTYEILSSNLPLPAVSTVRAKVHSSELAFEGEFRIKALKNYLQDRGYPMKVVLSEDGTRLVGKVMYHLSTNQVVGFVPKLTGNGIPELSSFPATSSTVMANYFQQNELSNYAYVIMAQPLSSKAPPFCVCVFGTINKFSADQVDLRWK
ncbi:Ras GTPase-activating-like protein IQGAP1 [Frankliniella fusca]|uniref:Ras GTPase-activating-like protein IQGAP1 n=1 Tax=Frankliniella fusca TaxID=407009 RepID=A0AAE1HNI6_9NEOP|nr:Ras GTPase-activating-like protein IQGAP1 [Frankliniella fusca]